MPRRQRTVTATRTTTEEITVTETEDTDVIPWAPGWDVYPDEARWRDQRAVQCRRTWDLVCAAADDGHVTLDPGTLRQAVTMLRALPGASCMELEHGRSV